LERITDLGAVWGLQYMPILKYFNSHFVSLLLFVLSGKGWQMILLYNGCGFKAAE
jgi:hypothetical protein